MTQGQTPVTQDPPIPPRWARPLTHVMALAWGSLELAFWGARPAALGFILSVIFLAEGSHQVAKISRLLSER